MPSTLSNSVRGSCNDGCYRRTKEISALNCWSALDLRTRRTPHICDGKFNAELGSIVWIVLSPQLPVVPFNNGSGNGQTYAHPLFFSSYEGVKNILSVLQAWSTVYDFNQNLPLRSRVWLLS
jgi:hypothetical protein